MVLSMAQIFPFLPPGPRGVALFGLLIVAGVALAAGLVAAKSLFGWRRLAARYRTAEPPGPGASFRYVSGWVGSSRYRNGLMLHVQPDGLRLSVLATFRPGHPPLLIPWGEISGVRRLDLLGWASVDLTVGAPTIATLQLPERVVRAIRAEFLSSAQEGRSRERRRG